MRTAVLGDHASSGSQPAAVTRPTASVACAMSEAGSFPWLFGHGRVRHQLGQATRSAEPHLQRIHGIGARVIPAREIVTGWLLAEIQDEGSG